VKGQGEIQAKIMSFKHFKKISSLSRNSCVDQVFATLPWLRKSSLKTLRSARRHAASRAAAGFRTPALVPRGLELKTRGRTDTRLMTSVGFAHLTAEFYLNS